MYTEIRIDGENVDLGDQPKVTIDLQNPHLSYESIPNSKASIPNIPFSPRNQRIFLYAEMPQGGNDLFSYDCESIYNGALVYHGKAYVKNANPVSGYQLEAGDDLGRFFGIYQDTLLSELDLGSVILPSILTPEVSVSGKPALCFPTILNPDFYSTNGELVNYPGRVNAYESGYMTTGPIVPALFVNYLLKQIAALTGITLSGSFLSHPTWSKLILTNWRALDRETTVLIRRHVPAWTIGNFLLELRKVPNLQLDFNSNTKSLTIDFWEKKMDIPPLRDWTLKATPGHDKYNEFKRRLQLIFDLDTGDSLMKDKPDIMGDYITPVTGALGSEAIDFVKVNFKLSTFLVDQTTGLPIAKQTGVTEEFNQLSVSTLPRLLFWHGLVSDIPTALPELNDISLYLTGPKGIAATSWKRTEQLRKEMFYLKKGFELNETDLALLDFSEQIHYNGLNYLVAHVSGELPITKEFQCLLVKI